MQCDIIRAHSPGRLDHPQLHGLLQRFRPLEGGRGHRPRLVGFLSARLRRGLSLHRGRAAALGRNLASRHRAVPPRSLPRRRARAVLGHGAAARPGELGAVEPRPEARHGAAVDLGGAGAWRRGGELFPLAPGALAQEQIHAGLNLPGLQELSPGGREAEQVGRELAAVGACRSIEKAPGGHRLRL